MRRSMILNIAFVLVLAALPLISAGTANDQSWLWQLGFLLLLLGLLIPPALRLRRSVPDPSDEPDVAEEP